MLAAYGIQNTSDVGTYLHTNLFHSSWRPVLPGKAASHMWFNNTVQLFFYKVLLNLFFVY